MLHCKQEGRGRGARTTGKTAEGRAGRVLVDLAIRRLLGTLARQVSVQRWVQMPDCSGLGRLSGKYGNDQRQLSGKWAASYEGMWGQGNRLLKIGKTLPPISEH